MLKKLQKLKLKNNIKEEILLNHNKRIKKHHILKESYDINLKLFALNFFIFN